MKRKNSVLNDSKNISHRIKNEITPILNYKDKTIKRNISSKCDAFYKSRKSNKNNISNGNNKITINNLSNHKNNNSNGQTNKNIKNKYLKKANSFTNQYVNKNNEKPLNENYLKKISNNHIPKYKNKNARNSKSKKNSSILKTELELITKFKEDHPFKPKINTQYNKNLKPETNKDRFTRLSRPKSSTQVIIKTKNNFDENKKVNSKKTSERLYKLHDQIKAKKEQVKKLFEENNNCSFTPEINLNSKKILANNNKNIYERNEDYEIKKQENLDKLKAKQKKEIINTIPKII